MVVAQETVELPASADGLAAVHAALDRFWTTLDRVKPHGPDPEWRARFATAVGEIAANIVRHAHPAGAPPGSLRLRLRGYATCVEAHFADRGLAYLGDLSTPPALPVAPGAAPDVLAVPEGGYGLALVLAAVDRMQYERTPTGENQWRLVKRFSA